MEKVNDDLRTSTREGREAKDFERTPAPMPGFYSRMVLKNAKRVNTDAGDYYIAEALVDCEPEQTDTRFAPSKRGSLVSIFAPIKPDKFGSGKDTRRQFANALSPSEDPGDVVVETLVPDNRFIGRAFALKSRAQVSKDTNQVSLRNDGTPWCNLRFYAIGGEATVPPAPPPSAPKIPEGFFPFPPNDPRHGKAAYSADGRVVAL